VADFTNIMRERALPASEHRASSASLVQIAVLDADDDDSLNAAGAAAWIEAHLREIKYVALCFGYRNVASCADLASDALATGPQDPPSATKIATPGVIIPFRPRASRRS
jgi:hypothetical protein